MQYRIVEPTESRLQRSQACPNSHRRVLRRTSASQRLESTDSGRHPRRSLDVQKAWFGSTGRSAGGRRSRVVARREFQRGRSRRVGRAALSARTRSDRNAWRRSPALPDRSATTSCTGRSSSSQQWNETHKVKIKLVQGDTQLDPANASTVPSRSRRTERSSASSARQEATRSRRRADPQEGRPRLRRPARRRASRSRTASARATSSVSSRTTACRARPTPTT